MAGGWRLKDTKHEGTKTVGVYEGPGTVRVEVEDMGAQAVALAIDRFGGDYRSFELKSSDGDDECKAACTADNKCRAWTYARPGYAGKAAHCFLKKEIKPPRRKAGYISGVVR